MQLAQGPTKTKGLTDAQCLDNGHVGVLKPEEFGKSLHVQSEIGARNVEILECGAVEMKPGQESCFSKRAK